MSDVEQMPLFEVADQPLEELEDVPTLPRGFITWAELKEQWGYEDGQFSEDHDGAMSPVEDSE